MLILKKTFTLGFLSGILLAYVILPLFLYSFLPLFTDKGLEEITGRLSLPPLPTRHGKLDYAWSLHTLDGVEVQLTKFQGQTIFLHFWATWCGPCIAEMPGIQRLYESVKDDGLSFLLVTDETEETVRNFLLKQGLTLPVYLAGKNLPSQLRPKAIPTTLVINHRGQIVFKHTGSARWDDLLVVEYIKSLSPS